MCYKIPNYKEGFTVVFSKDPFPKYDGVLDHKESDEYGSGNYYTLRDTDMVGWLCPALLKYFDEPPKSIYCKVSARD
jgi:hypothetical protein